MTDSALPDPRALEDERAHGSSRPSARANAAAGRRVRSGDRPGTSSFPATERARAALVDEHYADVYAWLYWLTRSRDDAADLTQDSFAAFWSSAERVTIRRPRTWLYRIARNRWRAWCRDAAVHRKRHDTAGDTAGGGGPLPRALASTPSPGVDAAMHAERDELATAAVAAVADLPRHYREAITLRVWADLTHAEIGDVLGIPAALARWRVHRARHLLRAALASPAAEPHAVPSKLTPEDRT